MFATALLLLAPAPDLSLAARYPVADPVPEPGTRLTWELDAEDAYRLTSFAFERSGQRFETGPATLVVGAGELGAVWLALLPDRPGTITGPLAGDGEPLVHAYLRVHPAELDALVPPDTVEAAPGGWRAAAGGRLALAKQRSSWQAGGLPVVPPPGTVVLDCGTAEPTAEGGPGRRRFYLTDDTGALAYHAAFEAQALPRDRTCDAEVAEAALDELWRAFDAEYAMFGLRDVDWAARRERLPEFAAEVRTTFDLARAVLRLVEPLDDGHAWVRLGDEVLYPRMGPQDFRANFQAVMAALGPMTQPRRGINWGRTDDGLGYLMVADLQGEDWVVLVDRALADLADVRGLVLDLRFNTGGDELLGRALAGRFAAEPVVYAKHRFRAGPEHDDLGPWFERTLEPRAPRVEVPVRVLVGPATMSSAEALALMFRALPDVRLVGLPTRGSTGNPRAVELPGDVVVGLPRWLAAAPDGTPIEAHGVHPDRRVEASAEDLTTGDPILAAALGELRAATGDGSADGGDGR